MSVSERLRFTERARRWRASFSISSAFHINKIVLWAVLGVLILIAIAIIAAFFIDEPLRRHMESHLNRAHATGMSKVM